MHSDYHGNQSTHPGCKCPTSCDTASQDTPWRLSQGPVPPIDRKSCTHTAQCPTERAEHALRGCGKV